MGKFYTWDDLYRRATDKGWWEDELQAKDNARNQIGGYAYDNFGIDIEKSDCTEEEIDGFLDEHPELDNFDIDGNMTALYDEPISREASKCT